MRYQISYKYRREGSSSWSSTSAVITATSDYMAERCIEGRHPGCEVLITQIREI